MNIPLLKPEIPSPEEFLPYYERSIEAGHYANGGPCAQKLEKAFSVALGGHCRLVNNATMGLTILLSSLNLPKGSKVGVSSFTFSATIQSILEAGLEPMIFDCDDDMVFPIVSNVGDMKAVVVTHPFGIVPENYKELYIHYKEKGLYIVHDAAASIGNPTGALRDCLVYTDGMVYSLHATKTFGTGEGGLIQVDNIDQAKVIEIARNFGMVDGEIVRQGFNGKLPEIVAAIGCAQLDRFFRIIADKKERAIQYKSIVQSVHTYPYQATHPYQVMLYYTTKQRELVGALTANGMGSRVYYIPLHRSKYLEKYRASESYPNSERFASNLICLPFYSDMTEETMHKIKEVIRSV